jgi:enterochelin esterase-like enzyme
VSAIARYLALALIVPGLAQARPAVVSPEVLPDHRVVFRLDAPQAISVVAEGDFLPPGQRTIALARGADGVWSATTAPLAADYYSYDFVVDGVTLPDPADGDIKPGARSAQSAFLVPGDAAALVTPAAVPHGEIRQLFYTSPATHALRRMHVYLPPDYDARPARKYPVVYLFHGGGDNDTAWTTIGRVNVMLDSLIAQGKARPMIVVMPDLWTLAAPGDTRPDVALFRADLLDGVIPTAQARLRIAPGAANRAVGGLGVGRAMLPVVVWPVLNRFGTVFFASGGAGPDQVARLLKTWPDALAQPGRTRFFMGDGAQDSSLADSQYLAGQLRAHGFAVTAAQSDQGHGWPAFRRAFAAFAEIAFRTSKENTQ